MATGAFSGRRGQYIYTSDEGDKYVLTTSKFLGDLTDNGLVLYNPTSAVHQGYPDLPRRFRPRIAFWKATNSPPYEATKRIICGTNNCNIFKLKSKGALTIDTQQGVITGKKGEARTYR